jgi:hypothetical protein
MGPFTVKVLSKVPSALERELHPARSRLARAADAANVAKALRVCDPRWAELITFVAGMIVCAIGARGWASFLSEIYEDVQPEVPGGIRAPETKAARFVPRGAGQSGQYTSNGKCDGKGTANAAACDFTSI